MRPRWGQSWHAYIEHIIKDSDIVNPKELSLILHNTITPHRIASILRSLGWTRHSPDPNNNILVFYTRS